MADPAVAYLTAAVVRDGDGHVARCLDVDVAGQGTALSTPGDATLTGSSSSWLPRT